jgi:Raf kinase inhibitor-like YbhB/YbcL family protein
MALTVIDRDSAFGTWLHWLVYDIPVKTHLSENSVPGRQGMNSFGKTDYGGPCPQAGTHRYFFTLYALDTQFNFPEGKTLEEIEVAMAGHVITQAELVGLYRKPPVPQDYREIRI